MICYLQVLFIKCCNNFITIKMFCHMFPLYSVFNFFKNKHFLRPIWTVAFWKNIFIFCCSNMITEFKFKILIIFYIKINICTQLYSNRLFGCSMTCIILFINYIILFMNIFIVWYWSHIFIEFILLGSKKPFRSNRFSVIMCWIHFYTFDL